MLRRFSADVGRQPPPAAPFYFGPWWQPDGDAAQNIAQLKAAGALGSLMQTYTHYLPCGDQQGHTAEQQAMTAQAHDAGLAITTYFNPMICTTYQPPYGLAAAGGFLNTNAAGQPYVYPYTGSRVFPVSQFDFTAPGTVGFYGDLLSEAVGNGYDGWMEDFGEYTPPDARSADGTPGPEMHNATRCSTTAPPTRTRRTARRARWRASTARAGPARRACRRSCGAATPRRASASTA